MNCTSMHVAVCAAVASALFLSNAPVRASEADDRIETSFQETYVYRTYLKDDDVKADANNGVLTLTGIVVEQSHKALAQETASNLPGVNRVENELETKAEAAAENADTWIGRKLRVALLFHRNVNSGNTAFDVKDGVVTLTGEASSAAQKELTAEYARDIENVKEVKNEMTVAAKPAAAVRTEGEKIDDASITALIKTALMTHRSTSSITAKVETWDGKVTVTGIAANAAEKTLVTKLISDIVGVASVNNEMTVEADKTR